MEQYMPRRSPYKESYILNQSIEDPCSGAIFPEGTVVRVHDWNEACVTIAIDETRIWMPLRVFKSIIKE